MKKLHFCFIIVITFFILFCLSISCKKQPEKENLERGKAIGVRHVEVRLDPALITEPVTGRVFLLITDRSDVEPRLVTLATYVYYFNAPRGTVRSGGRQMDYAPFFGLDVEELEPGAVATVDERTNGFPFKSLSDLPPGEYYVQALLHIYTKVTPAHGHTIWLPMDHWEGQQFHLSPGNLFSDVEKINVEEDSGFQLELELNQVIPPIDLPPDTKWVKHIKIKSDLISEFWGHDMYLGAKVLLPKGYEELPDVHYPVLYLRGHFSNGSPLRFPGEKPQDPGEGASAIDQAVYENQKWLWENWITQDMPRFIVVTLQHPTPFYDDSYSINSPNQGPYDDAIMQELIPYIEERFRIIRKPYARVMTGGSTGGWISLYAQIRHPEFFGGAWVYCPDWVDFRSLMMINIYDDDSAFVPPDYHWLKPERPFSRTVEGQTRLTLRQFSQMTRALGSRCRSGEFLDAYAAMFGPVGEDGYPVPLWDYETGEINHEIAQFWRNHGYDLRHYLEENWSHLGSDLVGRLFFLCGDMDDFYANVPLYLMEDFLKDTKDPHYGGSFRYGRPKVGHTVSGIGLDPWPFALLREMADHITVNAPSGEDTDQWKY